MSLEPLGPHICKSCALPVELAPCPALQPTARPLTLPHPSWHEMGSQESTFPGRTSLPALSRVLTWFFQVGRDSGMKEVAEGQQALLFCQSVKRLLSFCDSTSQPGKVRLRICVPCQAAGTHWQEVAEAGKTPPAGPATGLTSTL